MGEKIRSFVEGQRFRWLRDHPDAPSWVVLFYPRTVRQYFNGEPYAWIEGSNPSLSDYIEIVW